MVGLLTGGKGRVDISNDARIVWGKNNFAIRSRKLLHSAGFATAVIAPPSDLPNLFGQRHRDSYAVDIGNVIAALRQRFRLPVWLHGTSRGTVGIAQTVPKITDPLKRPDGLVLSATVTKPGGNDNPTIYDGALAKIIGPVLLLHHADDACHATPLQGARDATSAFRSAGPVELSIIRGGGKSADHRACGSRSYHGFIDVDKKAADAIVRFIKSNIRLPATNRP